MSVHERTQIESADGISLETAHHFSNESEYGTVLLAHGLTQDMDEGGMYVRLTDNLTEAGFDVVRFSYRGHGASEGDPEGVTIAGECLDFERAFEHTREQFEGPFFVVAKSFGAVSACLSLDRFESALRGLVLWNPVLDIEGTFLNPSVPWGIKNFTGDQLTALQEQGHLSIGNQFKMGRVLYQELHRYDPGVPFRESSVPALVIHGDADEIVPYEDTRRVADQKGAEFYTVANGGHGFVKPDEQTPLTDDRREQDHRTVTWLLQQTDA